jgi:protein-disulfide isomerase
MSARWAALVASLAIVASSACGDGPRDPRTASPFAPTATATPTPADVLSAYAAMAIPAALADGDALGDPAAPVTLTLYEDFQCPFCLAFNLQFEAMLIHDYVEEGKVLLQFRHYPILGEESLNAARAAVCAADQDVFWPFHNRLFLEQARAGQLTDERINIGRFSDANLRAYAIDAGAHGPTFDACYADPSTTARVQADITEARMLGLRGTPSLVLNGEPVTTPRDIAAFRAMLDGAIAASP